MGFYLSGYLVGLQSGAWKKTTKAALKIIIQLNGLQKIDFR